jgi:hypothetical protein
MLEKICTDLETSKRLKELGFEAETDFYWTITTIDEWNKNQWNIIYFKDRGMAKYEPTVPAYTLEQILKKTKRFYKLSLSELPDFIEVNNSIYHLMISKNSIYYFSHSKLKVFANYQENNLSTSAAKLWIKLKEDEII